MKFNYVREVIGDKEFVFVTRGKSKPFTEEEKLEFIDSVVRWDTVEELDDFRVPSSKVFSQDLRAGLDFCSKKYGVSKETIRLKAAKVFPHLTISQLT